MKHMHAEKLVTGLCMNLSSTPDPICEPCIAGKQRLALIHSDLKGPLPPTRNGYRYWITFIDDAGRFKVVLYLKKKSEAFGSFKQFKTYAANKLGVKIKALRDDKSGEYMSKEFGAYCAEQGIRRQHTEPNEPHQNGIAERANLEIALAATAMLIEAKLPLSFWDLAVSAYIHVSNQTPASLILYGRRRNPISRIFVSLEASPTFWFERRRGSRLRRILGNVSLLAMVTG